MAKKPKAPDWLIENIAEASKNARKIYFLYFSFLAYCSVTVVGTSDRQIILNETVSLPILNLDVSLNGFFILAPLIAILLFIYFQLYLHRLKGLTDDLRDNYASIEKRRLYPWMINIAEDPEPGLIGKLQSIIVKGSLWVLLPLCLILIAISFVKKHDPVLSYIVGITPIVGTFMVLFFWCQHEGTQFKEFLRRNLKAIFVYIALIIASAVLAFLASVLTFILLEYPLKFLLLFFLEAIGVFIVLLLLLSKLYLKWRGLPLKDKGITILISSVLAVGVLLLFMIIPYSNKGSFIRVNLSYQNLITEPKKDYEGLFWGNLRQAHLEGAELNMVILERCNLRGAYLKRASMFFAVLKEASLWGANLQEAGLGGANLQGADLQGANLQGAHLWRANLQGAKLWEANLQGVDLQGANLQGADLWGANLQKADLRGAKNLKVEQLSEVKTLFKAKLDSKLLEQIKEIRPHFLEKPKED